MSQVSDHVQIVDHDHTRDEAVLVAKLCDSEASGESTLTPSRRRRHIEMLIAATVVLTLAAILRIPDGQRVALPGMSWLTVPEMCFSKAWFGVSCPGCGLTRSFICMMHGHLSEAFAYNRVGPILFLFTVLQFPYRLFGLKARRDYPLGYFVAEGSAWLLIGLLIGNWLVGFWL